MDKDSKYYWIPVIELAVLAFTTLGTTITLFLHSSSKMDTTINAIQQEMKEFHGRIEKQDAEFRGTMAKQDAEFHGTMARQDAEFRGIMAKQDAEFKAHLMYEHKK